jgi:hypothetical protein
MSVRVGSRRRGYGRNRQGASEAGYGRGRRYGRPYARRRSGNRSAGGAGALNMFARLGFVARGITYIVIGAIATKPFGYLLLWILVIGFLGLAVWRLVQAAVKRLNLTEGHRIRALATASGMPSRSSAS